MRGTWLALIIFLGLPAYAENLDKARAYFKGGVEAYDEGRYEPALREFQHAHALSHSPALYFNMAACEEHLRHEQAAALLLRQYLIETPDAEDRVKVEARIKVLEERGDAMKRLAPEPTTPSSTVPPVVPVAPPPPASRWVAAWAMLGVTGALGVAALATGGYAVAKHVELRDSCGGTADGCPQTEIDGLHSVTVADDVLIGLTAAAAVTTVVLLIVEPRLSKKKLERAARFVGPNGLVF
jgi:hypothetical protein